MNLFGNKDQVTITNREIYDAVLANKAATDAVLSKVSTLEVRDTDHEARLRGLEQWRWKLGGVVGVLSVAASAVISLMTK
ncbi:hypothetical protein ACFWQL_11705 [Amycolatopsis thermoflava]|uniref:hypothetical protein n=1 Tax=Amycolatopsis thermoflava TaxID=84480 RepID=UPI0036650B19